MKSGMKCKTCGKTIQPLELLVDDECILCIAMDRDHHAKAADYYKAGILQRQDLSRMPRYVPCRVRLDRRISGDWPIGHTSQAGPGEMECTTNKYGAVSVRAEDGKQLGLKLDEFEPIEWAENPAR